MVLKMAQWSVPVVSRNKYYDLFRVHDTTRSGFLTGTQAKTVLLESGLNEKILAQIWNLSDVDSDGRLSTQEFILAMHLIDIYKEREILPSTLTPDLLPPLECEVSTMESAAVTERNGFLDCQPSCSRTNNSSDLHPSNSNLINNDSPCSSRSRPRSKRHASDSKDGREGHKERRHTRYTERPGRCTSDYRIKLLTNHYHLSIPDISVYMYNISMVPVIKLHDSPSYEPVTSDPRFLNKFLREYGREVYSNLLKSHPQLFTPENHRSIRCVYDGSQTIYSPKRLEKIDQMAKNCKDENRIVVTTEGPSFEVKLKFSTKVNLQTINSFARGNLAETPWNALQAIDIIIYFALSRNMVQVSRNFFTPTANERDEFSIGVNKILKTGHSQSCKITQLGPTLNVDRVSSVFSTSGPILPILVKAIGRDVHSWMSFAGNNILKNVFDSLVGLKVFTNHGFKKSFKLKEFTLTPASDQHFSYKMEDGTETEISVEEYFKLKYKITLKYPNAFCIKAGSKKRPVFYPLEVVEIYPNQLAKKVTQGERINLIRANSGQLPHDRLQEINRANRTIQEESVDVFKHFKLKLSHDPIKIDGYRLIHPEIEYGRNELFSLKFGKWDMRDKKILEPARGLRRIKWMVVNLARNLNGRGELVEDFICRLVARSRQMDMELCEPVSPKESNLKYLEGARPFMQNTLKFILNSHLEHHPNLDLIVFIFEEKNDHMYREIKYLCDVEEGINCQCVSDKNILNMNEPTRIHLMTNLLLQINCRLGGINGLPRKSQQLENILNRHTLVIGADVSHPTGTEERVNEKLMPSICSVAASMDSNHYFYECSIRAHKKFCEVIESMKEMVHSLLIAYLKRNKNCRYPKRIFYFRDGVAEGMFDATLSVEVAGIRDACNQISPSFNPKITVIVAQKRHNTRFFPVEKDRKNVPSGTLVDSRITHPCDFDYFLCSHNSYLGTSRPTHYTVILDENNLDADTLYNLTFHLCHTYAPATRSISIPAPIAYAHLSAKRTRNHIFSLKDWDHRDLKTPRIHERIKSNMYFI